MLAYIAIAALIIAVYITVNHFGDFSRSQKRLFILLGFVLFGAAVAIERYNDTSRAQLHDVLYAFDHNYTVVCGEQNVSKQYFNYSAGGHSFLGRETTPYAGKIISAYVCNLVKE